MAVPSLVELCIRTLAQDSQLSKLVAALRESELSGLEFLGTDLCQALLRQAAQRGNVTAENLVYFHGTGVVALPLAGCVEVGDAAVASAAAALPLNEVTLNYSSPPLTNHVLHAIGKHCRMLTTLRMAGHGLITEDAVISVASHCPSLTAIDLSHCKKLHGTTALLKRLAEALPGLQDLRARHLGLRGSAGAEWLARCVPCSLSILFYSPPSIARGGAAGSSRDSTSLGTQSSATAPSGKCLR